METCYRHPERETGVSCSNCGRPICPDCMTSTSVGMRCPECAHQKTKVRSVGSSGGPTLTYALIAINVIVALGLVLGGAGDFGRSPIYEHGALISSGRLPDGSTIGVAHGEYWRLVTSGFIHGSGTGSSVFLHLLFNMFALYVLGGMLEPAVGRVRFGAIYLVSILAGSFGALLISQEGDFTAGASVGVFGLMGAAVVVMRNRGINPMESGLGLWIGLNLLITFTIPNISIGGHIGGLIGGALVAFVMFDLRERVKVPDLVPTLLAGAIGVAAVIGSIAVSASATA
ncbi:MAG: rhomboid family intramembrane serine protease [Thermoleophilaceae bacterium]